MQTISKVVLGRSAPPPTAVAITLPPAPTDSRAGHVHVGQTYVR